MKKLPVILLLLTILPVSSVAEQNKVLRKGISGNRLKTIREIGRTVIKAKKNCLKDLQEMPLKKNIKEWRDELIDIRKKFLSGGKAKIILHQNTSEKRANTDVKKTDTISSSHAGKINQIIGKIKKCRDELPENSKNSTPCRTSLYIQTIPKLNEFVTDLEAFLLDDSDGRFLSISNLIDRLTVRPLSNKPPIKEDSGISTIPRHHPQGDYP